MGESSGDNTDYSMNFVPKMNFDALQTGYKRVLSEIYSPHGYYVRVRTFLRDFNPSPDIKPPLTLTEVAALFRSIYLQGITGVGRLEYWRLFFWALFRRPRLFPMAITMSVYGHHFRQVYELYVRHPHLKATK